MDLSVSLLSPPLFSPLHETFEFLHEYVGVCVCVCVVPVHELHVSNWVRAICACCRGCFFVVFSHSLSLSLPSFFLCGGFFFLCVHSHQYLHFFVYAEGEMLLCPCSHVLTGNGNVDSGVCVGCTDR